MGWRRRSVLPWQDRLGVVHPIDELTAVVAHGDYRSCVTHGDANQKNVIVDTAGTAFLCDWDSTRTWSPRLEAAAVALSWAGVELGDPSPGSAAAFLSGYAAQRGDPRPFRESDLVGWAVTWLAFTAFNVRRCVGAIAGVDDVERERASALVETGIHQLTRFADRAHHWTAALNETAV